MKCPNCNQEVPAVNTICPFCNSNVVNNVETPSVPENSIPVTPTDYVLPKDQAAIAAGEVPVQESAPVEQANVQPTTPVPAPPTMDASVPAPNVQEPTYVDPKTINLDNVDLNANPAAQSVDLTKTGEKIASTIDHSKQKDPKKKKKRKARVLLILLILVLLGTGAGGYFYYTQYTTSDKRIDATVNQLLSFTSSFNKAKIEYGSGTYNLTYTSEKNNDNLSLEVSGKYGYDLPNKKIDVIANIKKYNHNVDLLSTELNTELYLENKRAYVLMPNFDERYIYTDISNSKNVIDDIKTRFNNPDDLMLFSIMDKLYSNGLDTFSNDYEKYINNISQNDINYTTIISGIKKSIQTGLKQLPHTQQFENNQNVIVFNIKNQDTYRTLYSNILSSFKENKQAYSEMVKLYGGNENDFYNDMLNIIDNLKDVDINSKITIVTDPFKETLISVTIPVVKDNKVIIVTIKPIGGGYSFVGKQDKQDVFKLTYTKSTTKESQTQTKKYNVKGTIYTNNVADNIELNLEVVDDITPKKVEVMTRNSVDYQYLTIYDRNTIASKIKEFGNLGVIFSSAYKGSSEPTDVDQNEGDVTPTGDVNE